MKELKESIQKLNSIDPELCDSIRRRYYAVSDNLMQLAEDIERADHLIGENGGPLLEEHFIYLAMNDQFERSEIGRIL